MPVVGRAVNRLSIQVSLTALHTAAGGFAAQAAAANSPQQAPTWRAVRLKDVH